MEYGRNNIRACTIALGNTATEATFNSMNPEDRKMASEEASMKIWGKSEEIVKLAFYITNSISYLQRVILL